MFPRVRRIAGLLSVFAAGLAGAQQYTIVDLGTLGGSASGRPAFSSGNGINFSGQVTGSSISNEASHQEHAFVTSLAGTMSDLGALAPTGPSQGMAISDLGQIAGNTATSRPNQPVHAFVTDLQTNAMIDLGTLACGTADCNATSYGTAINLFGQVAGYSTIATSTSTFHAFVTNAANNALIDLSADCDCASQALGINVYGDLTGWIATPTGNHAFFANGSYLVPGDIGTLGGSTSTGRAINGNQEIAGDSLLADGTDHAFLWGRFPIRDLGTLGGAGSRANGLTDGGIVTGTAQTRSGDWHAFVWINDKMTDLNAAIGAASSLYTLSSGQAINDQGQIVANGTETATGLKVALLLTPVPVPQTPTVSVSVTPARPVAIGEPAAFSWTSTSAISCAASGSWSAAGLLAAGSHDVQFAKAGSYGITVTCTGAGGSASASATVVVIVAPILSFSASDIPVNATTVLTWKAFPGATACAAAGAWSGDLPLTGSRAIGPLPIGGYGYQISCTGAGVTLGASAALTVFTPGELNYSSFIASSPNVTAVRSPGTPAPTGGLDGHGYTYNTQALPYPLTAFGQTFEFGRPPGTPAAFSKQTVEFPNEVLAYVTILATGVNGNQPNQPFVLTYSDGSQSTYVQSLSDWGSPQHYAGEITAAAMTSRITPTGATQSAAFNLYAYRIPVDGAKGLVGLKLPPNRNVIVLAVNTSLAPTVGYFALPPYFNVNALATAGLPASNGGLDGHGYALDADLVPPGFVWSGQQFPIGPANAPSAITKSTVALQPMTLNVSLTVLATAANGAQTDQTFLVTYTDGSSTLFTQSVSDWGKPQSFPGESVARTMLDRITPTGGRQAGHWNLYAYRFQVDPKKVVASMTLPKNRNVIVLAITSLAE